MNNLVNPLSSMATYYLLIKHAMTIYNYGNEDQIQPLVFLTR